MGETNEAYASIVCIDAFVERETNKLRRVCVNEIKLTIFVCSRTGCDNGKVALPFLPGTRDEASLDTVPNISYKGEIYVLT